MTATKKLGIWMDHSNAHIMELNDSNQIETKTIESNFTHEEKDESLQKSESLMHNKEQHDQSAFYKKLGEVIQNYDEVILFGPTEAKVELFNILRADHQFGKIKIKTQQADKMTTPQQHAFVKKYFKDTIF
jgi:hypothetical protein